MADVTYAQSREPKLFYVSSSSTTSSITTATVCYVATSAGGTTCGKRRRRSMIVSGGSDHNIRQIQPMDSLAEETEVEYGAEEQASSDRDGRFLLYWLTTTSTSTTTIFTGT